jgi:hypothetical protein
MEADDRTRLVAEFVDDLLTTAAKPEAQFECIDERPPGIFCLILNQSSLKDPLECEALLTDSISVLPRLPTNAP